MFRIARCQCGSLQVGADDDPDRVYVCHCQSCQRWSGAVFGSGAYFRKQNVHIEGARKEYIREAEDGRKVRFYFCPTCGSTVYYDTDKYPEHFGIPVGCFADPSFPAPAVSVWESNKHDWVGLPSNIKHFQRGSPAPAIGS